MNNKSKIVIAAAIGLLLVVALCPWILDAAGLNKAENTENRVLKEFPKGYSDSFVTEVVAWFKDHSPMRNEIVSKNSELNTKMNDKYADIQALLIPNEPDTDVESTPQPTTIDFGDLFGDNTAVPTLTPAPSATAEAPSEATAEATPGATAEAPSDATADATPEATAEATPGASEETAAPTEKPTEAPTPVPTAAPTEVPVDPCSIGQHDYIYYRSQSASVKHDGYTIKTCRNCGAKTVTDIQYRTSVSGFKQNLAYIEDPNHSGYRGLHDWIFYKGDDSTAYYLGTNTISTDEMKKWENKFEELQSILARRGVKLVVFVAPNKEQVYSEYLPSGIGTPCADSEKREARILSYMKANCSVPYLYPINELKTAKILYETYFQQDTHWNSVGGFIGAMSIYSALGMETTNILNLSVDRTSKSGGDLVNLSGTASSKYDEYNVNYKSQISYNAKHFPNTTATNSELGRIESTNKNGKRCVIIGDSFRHALYPIFAKDYQYVTYGHRQDFYTHTNESQLVIWNDLLKCKEGDLVVLQAVERFDYQNYDIAVEIVNCLNNPASGWPQK